MARSDSRLGGDLAVLIPRVTDEVLLRQQRCRAQKSLRAFQE